MGNFRKLFFSLMNLNKIADKNQCNNIGEIK